MENLSLGFRSQHQPIFEARTNTHTHTHSSRPMKHIHQREKRKRTLFAMVKLPTTCLVEKRGNHRRKVFPLFSHERFISFPPHEWKRVFPFHRNVVCQYFPSFPPEPSHGDGLFMTLESSLSNEILAFFLDIFRHCGGGKFITTFSLFVGSRCASFRCLWRPPPSGRATTNTANLHISSIFLCSRHMNKHRAREINPSRCLRFPPFDSNRKQKYFLFFGFWLAVCNVEHRMMVTALLLNSKQLNGDV